MPKRYVAIKESIRKQYPNAPLKEVKTRAAKIYESSRQPGEIHLATARARERKLKVSR